MSRELVARFLMLLCLTAATGFVEFAHADTPLQVPCAGCYSGDQTLSRGQSWSSQNGDYSLTFQSNGDLVETYDPTGQIVWDAQTAGLGGVSVYSPGSTLPSHVINNLSLEMLNANNQVVWYTPILSDPNNYRGYLQIQSTGEMVIYELVPIWSTNTSVYAGSGPSVFIPEGTAVNRGAVYTTAGGACALNFQQTDGNLVIYAVNQPEWATYTENEGASYFKFQYDSNFVVYNSSNTALWNSGTENKGASGSYLVFQPDCDLVIYSPSQKYSFGG